MTTDSSSSDATLADQLRWSVLQAIAKEDAAGLRALLDGSAPGAAAGLGSCLAEASRRTWWPGAHLLLEAGADSNAHEAGGKNALRYCADATPKHWPQALELAARILKLDMEAPRASKGMTFALEAAVTQGNATMVGLLLTPGASVGVVGPMLAHRAVQSVSDEGHLIAILDLLTAQGLKLGSLNGEGRTALFNAASLAKPQVCSYLCAHGCLASDRDEGDCTPLHFLGAQLDARTTPEPEILQRATATLQVLLANGADLEAHNLMGETPLIMASEARIGPTISGVLLDAGADIEGRDNDGNTALHVAATKDLLARAQFLLARGADPHAPNARQETPLMVAQDRGHAAVAAALESFAQRQVLEAAIKGGSGRGRRRV